MLPVKTMFPSISNIHRRYRNDYLRNKNVWMVFSLLWMMKSEWISLVILSSGREREGDCLHIAICKSASRFSEGPHVSDCVVVSNDELFWKAKSENCYCCFLPFRRRNPTPFFKTSVKGSDDGNQNVPLSSSAYRPDKIIATEC